MRDYGKVHTSFWASDTLRDLDADAKLLALYLLTCQHTHMAGVFNLPDAYASHDMGWDTERLSKGFETLSAAGWLRRDRGWVWIVKFGKFNQPDNPNQRKAVAKQLALVPDNCSFRGELLATAEPLFNGYGNPPTPTPTPIPVPTQEAPEVAIPLDDGSDHLVYPADLSEWRSAYPRIDPLAECRKARAWCLANAANRKTRRGVGKFLNGWMARAQKDAEKQPQSQAALPGGGRRAL